MSKVCLCSNTLSNTGSPSCEPIAKVLRKLIITSLYQDDGTVNEIDLTATLNLAFFSALRDNANGDERIYPLMNLDNVEQVAEDSIVETLNSGQNLKIQDGARSVTGLMVEASPAYLGQVEDLGCGAIGAYIVDLAGNLIGDGVTNPGSLRPIKIDSNTWDAIRVPATDTTVEKIQLKFNWDRAAQDRNLRMVKKSEMANADLLGLNGLFDVLGEDQALPTSTTQLKVKLFSRFGSVGGGVPTGAIEGLTASEFEVYNVTQASQVTPSAAVESPEGTYLLTFSAQTSADVCKLKALKSGLSADYVTDINGNDLTFTIP